MAVTFIDYKNDLGFYVPEDAMELAFQYIYKELNNEGKYSFSKFEDIQKDTLYKINGWNRGYLVLMWDDMLITPQDEKEMIRLLENILTGLKTKGNYISVEELQAFPSEAEDWKSFWSVPFPTQNLVKIFEALVKMLKGEWTSSNYGMEIDFNR